MYFMVILTFTVFGYSGVIFLSRAEASSWCGGVYSIKIVICNLAN